MKFHVYYAFGNWIWKLWSLIQDEDTAVLIGSNALPQSQVANSGEICAKIKFYYIVSWNSDVSNLVLEKKFN